MARKAFVLLIGLDSNGLGGIVVTARVTVYDSSSGVVVSDPVNYPDGVAFIQTVLGYQDNLNSIRSALQAAITGEYGFTPTFVWLDDKGLL